MEEAARFGADGDAALGIGGEGPEVFEGGLLILSINIASHAGKVSINLANDLICGVPGNLDRFEARYKSLQGRCEVYGCHSSLRPVGRPRGS